MGDMVRGNGCKLGPDTSSEVLSCQLRHDVELCRGVPTTTNTSCRTAIRSHKFQQPQQQQQQQQQTFFGGARATPTWDTMGPTAGQNVASMSMSEPLRPASTPGSLNCSSQLPSIPDFSNLNTTPSPAGRQPDEL